MTYDPPVDSKSLETIVSRLFEEQVEHTPEAVALIGAAGPVTYRELNARANGLAHRLIALGVGPEVRVAISIDRSVEMVVGIVGILKAGGAYVPLDPAYPRERLEFLLEDAAPRVLLVEPRLRDALPSFAGEEILVGAIG